MKLRRRDKVVLALLGLWWLTGKSATASAGRRPQPVTTPQSAVVTPGGEAPVTHPRADIEVRSTDTTPSGPPASATVPLTD